MESFIPNLVEIGQLVQKLKGACTHAHTMIS